MKKELPYIECGVLFTDVLFQDKENEIIQDEQNYFYDECAIELSRVTSFYGMKNLDDKPHLRDATKLMLNEDEYTCKIPYSRFCEMYLNWKKSYNIKIFMHN